MSNYDIAEARIEHAKQIKQPQLELV